MVTTTAKWPDANLESHIWSVGGKELVALSITSQLTNLKDCVSSCHLWDQYCRASLHPSRSVTVGDGSDVILPVGANACHCSLSNDEGMEGHCGREASQ